MVEQERPMADSTKTYRCVAEGYEGGICLEVEAESAVQAAFRAMRAARRQGFGGALTVLVRECGMFAL